jgi:hypothetical protein
MLTAFDGPQQVRRTVRQDPLAKVPSQWHDIRCACCLFLGRIRGDHTQRTDGANDRARCGTNSMKLATVRALFGSGSDLQLCL